MVNYKNEYEKKLTTADNLANLVEDNMEIEYGFINNFPVKFDRELSKKAGEVKGVKILSTLAPRPVQCIEKDPDGESFFLIDYHQGGVARKYLSMDPPRAAYGIMNFNELPRYKREERDIDLAVLTTTPMRKGFFNFGGDITDSKAIVDKADTVAVEVNESKFWVPGGYDESVYINDVDYIIENEKNEIVSMEAPEPTKTHEKIAENVAELVPKDGPTIQTGIGALPTAVTMLLPEFGVGDIGIHTEMVTEAMIELFEQGALTCAKKSFLPGKLVHTFAFGSRDLYDWMDENPMLYGAPVDFTNDPYIIALNNNMVTLNSTLEVDLQGQCCSESIGTFQWTGTGGQRQFVEGGYMKSPKGINSFGREGINKAIVTIESTWEDKGGTRRSSIKPTLTPGSIVTNPRTLPSYIVSEHGIAYLKGKSIPERVLEIINNVAHPNFREYLAEEAIKIGWLPDTWESKVFK